MERPSKKTLIPLLLVSIILPVGLIIGFNRTSEPRVSREFSVNAVAWNFTRPSSSTHLYIAKLITNSYNDDVGAIKFNMFMSSYYNDHPEFGDYLFFTVSFSANLTRGFVYGLKIIFTGNLEGVEEFDIIQDDDWVETRNLSPPTSHDSFHWWEPAYISARAVGNPSDCYLKMFVNWFFFDKNNIIHETTATAEVILYNGSEYVKIQIPISLVVLVA